MNIHYKTHRIKALIGFCVFLTANCLTAQDTGIYKLITTPYDTCIGYNGDILEANDKYYILSEVYHNFSIQKTPTVTIFDKELNQLQQFPLDGGGIDFGTNYHSFGDMKGIYKNGHFYVFGMAEREEGLNTFYFAKYNENFELVQPVSVYNMHISYSVNEEGDTLFLRNWCLSDVLLAQNNEIIVFIHDLGSPSRLLRLNDKGELLEEVLFNSFGDMGNLVETDSNYIVHTSTWRDVVTIFNKDSLSDYKNFELSPLNNDQPPQGAAVAVGNCLIRSYSVYPIHEECPSEWRATDLRIIFYDDVLREKGRIELGEPCVRNQSFMNDMHYLNPNFIYYAYTSSTEYQGTARSGTLSIACFSSEGRLHFDHTFWDIKNSRAYSISKCKAVSDGGVLVTGILFRDGDPYRYNSRGFLFYYRPPKNVGIAETLRATSLPQIFPNPAQSQFTVTNTENTEIQLFNTVGQEVFRTHSQTESTVVEVGSLPQGVYMLKVVQKDGSFSVHKVVKQ